MTSLGRTIYAAMRVWANFGKTLFGVGGKACALIDGKVCETHYKGSWNMFRDVIIPRKEWCVSVKKVYMYGYWK